MASKINTDDPRHHKYVSVNKRERKKRPRRLVSLVSLLFPRWMFEPHCHRGWNYRLAGACYSPGTCVVWDDCNHKTFRLLERRNGQRKGGKTERRHSRYSYYRRYAAGDVIHYKKGSPC